MNKSHILIVYKKNMRNNYINICSLKTFKIDLLNFCILIKEIDHSLSVFNNMLAFALISTIL